MKAYYNEFDSFPAQWLRNLINTGLIAPGDVDERSIEDVAPVDLDGYDRCHFFAGIAGWERALQLAGWPESWPVWTGSCPCQPFSSAGKGGKGTDERHLWPAWFHLIRVCHPPVIFGEQVASKDGLKWLDLVCSDLEAEGYAIGAADLCAAGVGAPHIRQRLWFCAVAHPGIPRPRNQYRQIADKGGSALQPGGEGIRQGDGAAMPDGTDPAGPTLLLGHAESRGCQGDDVRQVHGERAGEGEKPDVARPSPTGELADAADRRWRVRANSPGRGNQIEDVGCCKAGELADADECTNIRGESRPEFGAVSEEDDGICTLADADRGLWHWRQCQPEREAQGRVADDGIGEVGNFWSSCQWLPCRDGKWRPTKPGLSPLAHGVPQRVGRLRAAGNAISPQVAAEFIRAVMEAMNCKP